MAPRKQKRTGKAKAKVDLPSLEESVDKDLRGLLILPDDVDLEAVSQQIAADFEESLKKTASEL